jgi:hypothetical protein
MMTRAGFGRRRFCRRGNGPEFVSMPSRADGIGSKSLNNRSDTMLTAAQRKTYARDDIIPVVFLSSGIIDQHAVNETLGKIATVVPNLIVLVA